MIRVVAWEERENEDDDDEMKLRNVEFGIGKIQLKLVIGHTKCFGKNLITNFPLALIVRLSPHSAEWREKVLGKFLDVNNKISSEEL